MKAYEDYLECYGVPNCLNLATSLAIICMKTIINIYMMQVVSLQEKCEDMKQDINDHTQKAAPILGMLRAHIEKVDEEINEVKLFAEEKFSDLLQQFSLVAGTIQVCTLY